MYTSNVVIMMTDGNVFKYSCIFFIYIYLKNKKGNLNFFIYQYFHLYIIVCKHVINVT